MQFENASTSSRMEILLLPYSIVYHVLVMANMGKKYLDNFFCYYLVSKTFLCNTVSRWPLMKTSKWTSFYYQYMPFIESLKINDTALFTMYFPLFILSIFVDCAINFMQHLIFQRWYYITAEQAWRSNGTTRFIWRLPI